MHEMGVVLNIVRSAERLAKRYQLQKLGYITIEVGEISDALPRYIYQLWPQGTKGTICEGVPLKIDVVKAIAVCSDCKTQYTLTEHLKDNLPVCPKCGGGNFSFVKGSGVAIIELGVPE